MNKWQRWEALAFRPATNPLILLGGFSPGFWART